MAEAPGFPLCQPLPELPTGGYDDDYFLEPPHESLHCPVCLLVLREPHLISCCGAHICQVSELMFYYYHVVTTYTLFRCV